MVIYTVGVCLGQLVSNAQNRTPNKVYAENVQDTL